MPATFELAPEVERIAREIIATQVEHEHLRQARILYLFRRGTWVTRGKAVYGKAKKMTGELLYVAKQLLLHQLNDAEPSEIKRYTDAKGEIQYDFAIEINRTVWPNLTDIQRRALIDHELCHCLIDYKGNCSIVGHDVEEFASVIRRYGLVFEDTKAFAKAVRQAPDQMTLDDITAQQIADGLTVPAGLDGITVEMHGQKAEVARRAEESGQDDEDPAEALAVDEDEVAAGPLYRRYYCLACRKRIDASEIATVVDVGDEEESVHQPTGDDECGGPVFVALPGEPEPDLESLAGAMDHARAAS